MNAPPRASSDDGAAAAATPVDSPLYRRVWRWHFYAGLLCLPFLVLMAVTGGLYLYKDALEAWLHGPLLHVDAARGRGAAPGGGAPLPPEALVARARAAVPGEAVRFVAPAAPGRSAEVGVRGADGVLAVYLDPADGRVLGSLHDERRPMEVVKRLHSLVIAGPLANLWVEVVAGWAIVLVVSGVFLWWPRGRTGGVLTVRARPARRLWWRDLHAVTGVFASAVILFLAVTGMPWSAFWGEQFGRLAGAWGVGMPPYVWGPPPPSTPPLEGLREVTWSQSHAPLPESGPSHGHAGHAAPAK